MRTSTIQRSIGLVSLLALIACSSTVETVTIPGQAPGTGDGTSTDTNGTDPAESGLPVKTPSTDPSTPPGPVVEGLAISELAVFQGVKVDLLANDKWVSSRNAQVVAGRPGILRVYVAPTSSFKSTKVTAELRIVDGTKKLPIIYDSKTIDSASVETDLDSTFNLELPAEALTRTATFSVSLSATGGTIPTGDSDGRYPKDGSYKTIGAQPSGTVKVVVVPVVYNADGSGRTPDTTQAQLDLYKQTMMTLYPASDVEVTVRAPYNFSTAIAASGSGFSQILTAITQLRRQDGVDDDVYYYGAFAPKSSFGSYCGSGCVTGLSTVADESTPNLRASVGIGFSGSDSAETMAHEVGHAHGRNHAPCGGASGVDPDYPYSGAVLGVIGYDIFEKKLISQTKYHDMMSYCPPSWVSDYTYDALFQRIAAVSSSLSAGGSSSSAAQTYRTAEVQADGSMKWIDEVVLAREPKGGETRQVKFLAETGIQVSEQTARFYPYDHLPGGVMIVPTAKVSKWSTAKVGSISIK